MSTDAWGAPPAQDPWGAPPPTDQGWGGQEQGQTSGAALVPPSQEEYLSSESVTSFSFDGPAGTMVDGIVTSAKIVQKIDFDTKKPAFWDDGTSPKWTLRVLLQTLANEFQDDDGIRAVYYDYKKKESLDAAFKVAGVKAVVVEEARLRTRYEAGGPKDRNPNATKHKTYGSIYNPPGSPEALELKARLAAGRPPTQAVQAPPQQGFPAAAQPNPADLWKGLNQAAVDTLSAAGYGPQHVIPYIQDKPNWQGADANTIRGVIPPPPGAQPAQQAAWSTEPPF